MRICSRLSSKIYPSPHRGPESALMGKGPSVPLATAGVFRAWLLPCAREPRPEMSVCDSGERQPEVGSRSPGNWRGRVGWKRAVGSLGLVVGSGLAHSGVYQRSQDRYVS